MKKLICLMVTCILVTSLTVPSLAVVDSPLAVKNVPMAEEQDVTSTDNLQRASIVDCNIVLSNINGTGSSSSAPGTNTTKTIIGKSISPGYAMIKLSDLQYLGAETQIVGNRYYVTINGQTIVFTNGSADYTSSTQYTITKPEGGTQSYSFNVNGTTESDAKAQLIDGVPYVRLTDAVHQCGALTVNYNASENCVYVFHFRVNGNSAWSDNNVYIVGGSWLNNWSSMGTTQLAPHFKVNELWYSSTTGTYNCQLKISLASLQTEENVRFHYNGNSSINVTSGFRTWQGNYGTGGADKRSLHMRGRAIDATSATTQTLYNNIYDEFCGNASTPINGGSISWYSRVYGTVDSLSGAYDLEKMPQDNRWWVHLGVQPKYGDPM